MACVATSKPVYLQPCAVAVLFTCCSGLCASNSNTSVIAVQTAQALWQDIQSGAAEANPALLCRFLVLTFGDLKHFDFHYW